MASFAIYIYKYRGNQQHGVLPCNRYVNKPNNTFLHGLNDALHQRLHTLQWTFADRFFPDNHTGAVMIARVSNMCHH